MVSHPGQVDSTTPMQVVLPVQPTITPPQPTRRPLPRPILALMVIVLVLFSAGTISGWLESAGTRTSSNGGSSQPVEPAPNSQPTALPPSTSNTTQSGATPKPASVSATQPSSGSEAKAAIRHVLEEMERIKQESRRRVDDSELGQVTTGAALQQGIQAIKNLQAEGAYWEIELLSFDIERIDVFSNGTAQARVRKVEKRDYYRQGQRVADRSDPRDLYWIAYDLVLTQNGWRISAFRIDEETPVPEPTATRKPLPTNTIRVAQPIMNLEYRGLNRVTGTWKNNGVVKGQVLDRSGRPMPGARVEILINGATWSSDANPARVNADGWYEFFLAPDQQVSFVAVILPDGRKTLLSDQAKRFKIKTVAEAWQHIDFRQQ